MPTLCAERKPGRVQSGEPGRAQSGECPSSSTFVGSVSCSERRGMMATSSFMGQERFVDDHICADELVHGIMLREPVDRLVSNTAYAQRRGWNASAEEILALVEPGRLSDGKERRGGLVAQRKEHRGQSAQRRSRAPHNRTNTFLGACFTITPLID